MNLSAEHTVSSSQQQQYFAHVGQYGNYVHSRIDDHFLPDGVKTEYVDHHFLNHPQPYSAYSFQPLPSPTVAASPVPSSIPSTTPEYPHRTVYSQSPSLDDREVGSSANSTEEPIVVSSSQVPSTPRYVVCLDAKTAITRIDECTMTYLNKGQYYSLLLNSNEFYSGDVTCSVRLMFHDPKDRAKQETLWKYWLKLPNVNVNTRVIEVEKSSAFNAKNFQYKGFNHIQFQWNAQQGVRLQLRFNCLSTDFSMIKGIKGIPLRLHVQNRIEGVPHTVERCFCRVKLFRDKGAERKHKDDIAQIKRQMAKMKGADAPCPVAASHLGEPRTFLTTYPRDDCDISDNDCEVDINEIAKNLNSDSESDSSSSGESVPGLIRRRRLSHLGLDQEPLDFDPTYVPVRKRRRVLSLFVRSPRDVQYYAIYLNELKVDDLKAKIAEKLGFDVSVVSNVVRYTTRGGMAVALDDADVKQMEEEMPLTVELLVPPNGNAHSGNNGYTLALHY
ncbi:uncharacterized protein VTP21DRAFT_3872 [Calcarisporiella thermophila]|uniref:uncharacterized protein n=1 Tax=Calcarisporiella thermophila TaxID=911321 RepID=UPI003743833D